MANERGTLTQNGVIDKNRPSVENPGTSKETVTVGCKLPSGLVLRLFKEHDVDIPMFGGGYKTEKQYRQIEGAPTYTLNGFSHFQEQSPDHRIIHGFALTDGIPKDFFDEWMRQNRDNMLVKNGLIFAHVNERDAVAEAKEKRTTKSGFERLDPEKLPPQFKMIKSGNSKDAA